MALVIRRSVMKRGASLAFIFIEIFCAFPVLLIMTLSLSWFLTIFFLGAFLGFFYVPFFILMFRRIKKNAVIIYIKSEGLIIEKYGESIKLKWCDIRSVTAKEKIVCYKYGKIAGIDIETSLPSHKFIKKTRDIFIPDMFDASKEDITKQILTHVHKL